MSGNSPGDLKSQSVSSGSSPTGSLSSVELGTPNPTLQTSVKSVTIRHSSDGPVFIDYGHVRCPLRRHGAEASVSLEEEELVLEI